MAFLDILHPLQATTRGEHDRRNQLRAVRAKPGLPAGLREAAQLHRHRGDAAQRDSGQPGGLLPQLSAAREGRPQPGVRLEVVALVG